MENQSNDCIKCELGMCNQVQGFNSPSLWGLEIHCQDSNHKIPNGADINLCFHVHISQLLKYLLQGRLTKCPMTLSLGRTYV
jgi:hypothetical protein